MPREPRFHVPGDFYHVMSRGNHRDNVFMTDNDYRHYLTLIQRYAHRYKVSVHAYALMNNHVHLLVQEGEYPLGRFMQGVQQSYTQYFNTKYEQTGHLFQGRYKAKRIDRDEYLLALVSYIHQNPVKAGLVADPADYPWSSFRHYHQGIADYGIETGMIKGIMGQYEGREIPDYELMPESPGQNSDKEMQRSIPIRNDGQRADSGTDSMERLAEQVARFTCVPKEWMLGRPKDRSTALARWLFIYVATQRGHSLTAIAGYLQRSLSSVAMALQAVENDLHTGGGWCQTIQSFETTEELKA